MTCKRYLLAILLAVLLLPAAADGMPEPVRFSLHAVCPPGGPRCVETPNRSGRAYGLDPNPVITLRDIESITWTASGQLQFELTYDARGRLYHLSKERRGEIYAVVIDYKIWGQYALVSVYNDPYVRVSVVEKEDVTNILGRYLYWNSPREKYLEFVRYIGHGF